MAFIPGLSGELFRQFAVSVAIVGYGLLDRQVKSNRLARDDARAFAERTTSELSVDGLCGGKVGMSVWAQSRNVTSSVFIHLEMRHSTSPLALTKAPDLSGWAGLQGKGGGG
ncbi:hypothetical protein [Rhizobium gallicum]|uniref:hypothetical protein n=1 Tax=Rhizobium gallicum TaxID=56730 RepID=UPI001EF90F09|nr:hypothetical protein [Rhizobium gallicum]ULJ72403.1 hypothetical protein L2W42_01335 [Rhizobium gallicum]